MKVFLGSFLLFSSWAYADDCPELGCDSYNWDVASKEDLQKAVNALTRLQRVAKVATAF